MQGKEKGFYGFEDKLAGDKTHALNNTLCNLGEEKVGKLLDGLLFDDTCGEQLFSKAIKARLVSDLSHSSQFVDDFSKSESTLRFGKGEFKQMIRAAKHWEHADDEGDELEPDHAL